MNDKLYYVFGVHPQEGQVDPQHTLLGKFHLDNGRFTVLEDHGMSPGQDLETMPPAEAARTIRRLGNSQRRKVVSAKQLVEGEYPELLSSSGQPSLPDSIRSQLVEKPKGPKISIFDYNRQGMPGSQTLKLAGHKAFLDDQVLKPDEVNLVLQNVQSGKAQLRHHLQKSEDLLKAEPHLMEALGAMRSAVKAGQAHPAALQTMTNHLFADSLNPEIGNRLAYKNSLSTLAPGVHVHLDLEQSRNINEQFGHEVGSKAVASASKAIRNALDESVGRKNAKLFRTGGDKFAAHVPTHEHAAQFARALRAKFEAIPAIRGVHHLSASLGWGPTPDHAESALMDAKAAKNAMNYTPGQAKTHAASRMPGKEGVIPVE